MIISYDDIFKDFKHMADSRLTVYSPPLEKFAEFIVQISS